MKRTIGRPPSTRETVRNPRVGFALPLAILALVAVGLVLTAAIQLTFRSPPDPLAMERSTEAFYLAETGLNTVLAEWRPPSEGLVPWGDPDVVVGETGQGHWEAELLRVGEELVFIRSTGISAGAARAPAARRTIGAAARLEALELDIGRALTAPGPVELSTDSRIEDRDAVPPSWEARLCAGTGEPLEGPRGTSRLPEPGVEDSTSRTEQSAWDEIAPLANVVLEAGAIDGVAPRGDDDRCRRAHSGNWGDPRTPASPCGSYFPVVRIDGDAIVTGDGLGQGVLLVDGDLTIEGSFEFYGVVWIRGALDMRGGSTDGPAIYGAVRVEDPERKPVRLSGGTRLQYSHCAVHRAILGNDRLRRIRSLPGRAWVDLAAASL